MTAVAPLMADGPAALEVVQFRDVLARVPFARKSFASFADLATWLRDPTVTAKKDGVPLWSLVSYPPGATRRADAVQTVHAAAFEVDHLAMSELPTLRDRLRASGIECVVTSSHSHRSAGPKCKGAEDVHLRIVFKLARPVAGRDWSRVWTGIAGKYLPSTDGRGTIADPQARDPSRLFYRFSYPVERAPLAITEHLNPGGGAIDADDLPAPVAAAPSPAADDPLDQEYAAPPPDWALANRPAIIAAARQYLSHFPAAVAGQGGSDQMFNAARALTWGLLLTDAEAWTILREYNARAVPLFDTDTNDGASSLRKKLRDSRRADHARADKPAGHLLQELAILAQLRDAAVAAAKPIRWVPLQSFLKEDHPPVVMLAEPFVTAQSLTFVTAAPGSLKTWFVMHTALQIARGGKKVLLVLEEGRPSTLQKRFRLLGGADVPGVSVMVRQGLRIDLPAVWAEFQKQVLAAGFDVVIFDPFADFHLKDESNAPEMRALINQFKELAAAGPAVVVVHHTVKAAWGQNKDRPATALADARGAGSQMGSCDLAVSLVKVPREDGKDDTREADLYVLKDKDGVVPKAVPELPSHRLTLTFTPGNVEVEIEEVDPKAAKQQREARAKAKKNDKLVDQEASVLDVMHKPGGDDRPTVWIAANSGLGKDAVAAALARLETRGMVEKQGTHWLLSGGA